MTFFDIPLEELVILKRQLTHAISLSTLLLVPMGSWATDANSIADTSVNSGFPLANWGAAVAIKIGAGNTGLIQFGLSSLPTLTAPQIKKATMSFYVNTVSVAGSVDVSQVTSAWTETGVTYGTRPSFLSALATGVPIATAKQWVTVDVTQLVQDWVTGVAPNFGIQISAAAGAPSTSLALDSKENVNTSHPAFLDVVVQSVGPAGPTGAAGTTGTNGAAGATGPTGPSGLAGSNGPAGATGPTGAAGVNGAAGTPGTNGAPGAAGAGGVFTANAVVPTNTNPWYIGLNGETKVTTNNPEWTGGPSPLACTITKVALTLFTVSGTAAADTVSVTIYKNGASQASGLATVSLANAAAASSATTSRTGSISVAVGDVLTAGFTQTVSTVVARAAVGVLCN